MRETLTFLGLQYQKTSGQRLKFLFKGMHIDYTVVTEYTISLGVT